jgi:hypothetical protein
MRMFLSHLNSGNVPFPLKLRFVNGHDFNGASIQSQSFESTFIREYQRNNTVSTMEGLSDEVSTPPTVQEIPVS